MKKVSLWIIVFVSICLFVSYTLIGCKTEAEPEEEVVAEITETEEEAAPAEEMTEEGELLAVEIPTEPVTIDLWILAGPRLGIWEKRIALYEEEYPNVTIKMNPVENQNLRETMGTTLTSKNEQVDMFWYWSGGIPAYWAKQGLLYDMSPYFEYFDWYGRTQKMVQEFIIDGKSYGFPDDQNVSHFTYYNKAIFEEVGVEVPIYLEDMFSVSKEISDAGYLPLTMGCKLQWPQLTMFNQLLPRFMGMEDALTFIKFGLLENMNAERAKEIFLSQGALDSFTYLRRMVTEGVYPPDTIMMDDAAARLEFTTGRAAMYQSGLWILDVMKKEMLPEVVDNLSWFNFPKNPEGLANPMGSECGLAYFVPSFVDEKKLPVIADIMDHILTPEWAKLGYDVGLKYPFIFPEGLEKEWADPMAYEIYEEIEKVGAIPRLDVFSGTTEFNKLLWDTVDFVFQGKISPEEGCEELYNGALRMLDELAEVE